jgi:hypothetical protein
VFGDFSQFRHRLPGALKHYALLAALALCSVIPFASRAVFLDEHIFLRLARSAQTQWLFPQDTPGVFFGAVIEDFASHTHPPVGEYYLALIFTALGRFSEIPFRLAFSIFPLIAVFAFYSLARRFTAAPLPVAALFALSPAFFLYAPTLMMDVPMLAFLLAGFAFYFHHVDGRPWALPAASLGWILAVGTGYTAMIPIACLFVCAWIARRPARELLALAAAPGALLLWLAAMTIHFERFPLIDTARYFISQGSRPGNLAAVFTFLGGAAVFPLSPLRVAVKRFYPVQIFFACAALSLLWPRVGKPLWLAMLFAAGVAILTLFLISARRLLSSGQNKGEAFLLLWAPATLMFFVVAGDMINGRYILLAAPALFLVVFREASWRTLLRILAPTAALSLTLAYADAAWANVYRDFDATVVAPLQTEGWRIYSGAESGLRFYLEERGVETLPSGKSGVEPESLIVRHTGFPFRYGLAQDLERRLAPGQRYSFPNAFPIRTFNAASGAGFHDSRVGLSPFAFSARPFDGIDIQKVCSEDMAPGTRCDSFMRINQLHDAAGRAVEVDRIWAAPEQESNRGFAR